jgi:hypothetical protein
MRRLIKKPTVEQKAFILGFRTALKAVKLCENCDAITRTCTSGSCKVVEWLEAWFYEKTVL